MLVLSSRMYLLINSLCKTWLRWNTLLLVGEFWDRLTDFTKIPTPKHYRLARLASGNAAVQSLCFYYHDIMKTHTKSFKDNNWITDGSHLERAITVFWQPQILPEPAQFLCLSLTMVSHILFLMKMHSKAFPGRLYIPRRLKRALLSQKLLENFLPIKSMLMCCTTIIALRL